MQLSDIVIHVKQDINNPEKDKIIKMLRAVEGVIAPRFNKEKGNLLLVSYNSDNLSSLALLNKIRSNGYQASLVGL